MRVCVIARERMFVCVCFRVCVCACARATTRVCMCVIVCVCELQRDDDTSYGRVALDIRLG